MRLDGTVEVTHPNSTVSVYPLQRLTKLYDGIEQLEDDGWAEDTSDIDDSVGEDDGEGVWLKDSEGVWRYRLEEEADVDEWEIDGEDRDEDDDNHGMDVDEDLATDHMTLSSHPDTMPTSLEPITAVVPTATTQETRNDQQLIVNSNMGTEAAPPWKRFEILASAPHDHAFYASAPAQPSKNFLARLSREYRVLSNSLPGVSFCFVFIGRG